MLREPARIFVPHKRTAAHSSDPVQALDGFALCLWQLGEADDSLAGSNVFALLHRLSVEPDHLLRRSIITAVGASHPGKPSCACITQPLDTLQIAFESVRS